MTLTEEQKQRVLKRMNALAKELGLEGDE